MSIKSYCRPLGKKMTTYNSSVIYLIRLLTLSRASFNSIFINAGPISLNVFDPSSSKSNSYLLEMTYNYFKI